MGVVRLPLQPQSQGGIGPLTFLTTLSAPKR
jgi:hypothetical protein